MKKVMHGITWVALFEDIGDEKSAEHEKASHRKASVPGKDYFSGEMKLFICSVKDVAI